MKKQMTLGFIAICALIIFSAGTQSDNGKAGATNSPSEGNCTSCHNSFTINTGGGSISMSSTMTNFQYVPGQTYTINIKVKKTGLGLFGFDVEALTGANANAGTFVITNSAKTQIKNATVSGVSRANVVHQLNGGASNDSAIFSFNWNAPATNVGNVTFYFTGAACNGNGGTSSDYIYSGSQVVTPLVGYTVGGTVYNDANGLTDNTVNGAGSNGGGLYANLLNGSNLVVAASAVPASGVYSFSSVNAGSYTIQISTVQGTVGQTAPALTLPATYVSTGEFLGSGAGNDGLVNGLLPVTVTTANLSNANFGMDRLPVSNNVTAASQSNPGSTTKVLVPALSGSDAEDGAMGTGKSVKILSLPAKGKLYYNNILCTLNQVITGYDPTLLKVDPNTGGFNLTFTYSFVDAAGKTSASAATVSMPFVSVTLTVSTTSLQPFTATKAVPSVAQSFTISANNLIDSVKVTAPSKYQVSLSSTTGWKSFLKLAKNGTNQLPLTTIYVRYKPTAIGSDSGYVSCTATGATAKKVFVKGTAASRMADESVAGSAMVLAPNPVANELNILHLDAAGKITVRIYNITGSLVQSAVLEAAETHTIDVSTLPSGIYVCMVESGNNISNSRFIKQ